MNRRAADNAALAFALFLLVLGLLLTGVVMVALLYVWTHLAASVA